MLINVSPKSGYVVAPLGIISDLPGLSNTHTIAP